MRRLAPTAFFRVLLTLGVLIAVVNSTPASADELSLARVLDPDRVIEISIELPASDWKALCQQTRDAGKVFSGVIENPFTFFQGHITIDGVTVRSVGIRKKGFLGSLDTQCPSLKVKFDEYVDQSPIAGLDGLTLNNNKQDTSLVSQFLAYQLFNAAGVQAPRCNFVRLTVNGQYLGIYTHVESIGKPFLQRRFGNDTGNLYEGTLADFYPPAVDRLDLKTNKTNHDGARALRLATLLAANDAAALDEVSQLVDVENFLRFWALEGLIGFWDGYSSNQNNYWIYENRENGKFYFMPWGADCAFSSSAFPGTSQKGPLSVYAESMLANRLFHQEGTAQRYRETMQWLLANVWNEAELLKSVDHVEALVTDHLHHRQASAPFLMNSVRHFIRTRREKVEQELEAWPVQVSAHPRKPMHIVEIGSAKGSFATKWGDRPPTNVAETGSVQLQLVLNGEPVKFKQLGASVHRPSQRWLPLLLGAPTAQTAANLVIAGIRESDDASLTFTFSLDPQALSTNVGKPIAVQGYLSDGKTSGVGFMQSPGRAVAGNVTLASFGIQANDDTAGEFELTIAETRGGFMDRREPERGEGN